MEAVSRNDYARFSNPTIILHWLIALLIISNLVLAKVAEGLKEAERGALMGPHMALGIATLLLSVVLVIWRVTHPSPPYPGGMARWEKLLAKTVRTVFYVLIIAIPLSGWLLVSSYNGADGINWFGLFTIPALPVTRTEQMRDYSVFLHKEMGGAMIYLIGLHVLGALKHAYVDKHAYLHRMWPG